MDFESIKKSFKELKRDYDVECIGGQFDPYDNMYRITPKPKPEVMEYPYCDGCEYKETFIAADGTRCIHQLCCGYSGHCADCELQEKTTVIIMNKFGEFVREKNGCKNYKYCYRARECMKAPTKSNGAGSESQT